MKANPLGNLEMEIVVSEEPQQVVDLPEQGLPRTAMEDRKMGREPAPVAPAAPGMGADYGAGMVPVGPEGTF